MCTLWRAFPINNVKEARRAIIILYNWFTVYDIAFSINNVEEARRVIIILYNQFTVYDILTFWKLKLDKFMIGYWARVRVFVLFDYKLRHYKLRLRAEIMCHVVWSEKLI